MTDMHGFISEESKKYGADYYKSHCGPLVYDRSEPHWLRFFGVVADELIQVFRPASVFDAGCAHGFLVEALWDRGVQARGRDVSDYAISQVRADILSACAVGSLVEPIEGRYDLITCIEVLEHMEPNTALAALDNLTNSTDHIVFSSSPTDLDEPTHVNVNPPVYWLKAFRDRGFKPIPRLQLRSIAPWTIAFGRADRATADDELARDADMVHARIRLAELSHRVVHLESEVGERDRRISEVTAEAQRLADTGERRVAQTTEELERLRHQEKTTRIEVEMLKRRENALWRMWRDETDARIEAEGHYELEIARSDARRRAAVQIGAETSDRLRALARAYIGVQARQHGTQRDRSSAAPIDAPWGFDPVWYVAANADVAESGGDPGIHYLNFGEREGRSPNEVAQLRSSTTFDAEWYLRENPDVAEAGVDPWEHWVKEGRKEGRHPNAAGAAALLRVEFDAEWYRRAYADAVAPGVDPWLDFVSRGRFEGRARRRVPIPGSAGPVGFDAEWYLRENPDVAEAGADPWEHWVEKGRKEGRHPNAASAAAVMQVDFDAAWYRRAYADVAASEADPWFHFVQHGRFEGRARNAREKVLLDRRDDPYTRWIERNDTLSQTDRDQIRRHIARFAYTPLISVVVPTYNTNDAHLRLMIDSVTAQLYSNWELCIADDASTVPNVRVTLHERSTGDARIKYTVREINGHISAATNTALGLCSGEFVALLDHDDLLPETALYEVAALLNEHPDLDLIYSDSDSIDDDGVRSGPYFKTDWNPDLMLGHNMVSHLGVYRRSLVSEIGGLRVGYEGSQDYDLALRASRHTRRDKIRHIPAVLYHWRRNLEPTTFSERSLDRCIAAGRRAIRDHLRASGVAARLDEAPGLPNFNRVQYRLPDQPPKVSIVIPTRDRADLLGCCVDGVLTRTDYESIEVIVVDNDSREPATLALFERLRRDERIRIIEYHGAFNYAAMNNLAVEQAAGEIVVLLNNDIDVKSPAWLEELVTNALRPGVGAVGAKLLYPDGRVQHAGVAVGFGHGAGHLFHFASGSDIGYFGFLGLAREVTAVTGACMAIRREVYREVHGFDADEFPVAFNDVDLCLRLRQQGYANVWTPYAELIHHESATRGLDTDPARLARLEQDAVRLRTRWAEALDEDPFYNVNCTRSAADFTLDQLSRRRKPWKNF